MKLGTQSTSTFLENITIRTSNENIEQYFLVVYIATVVSFLFLFS